jgi:hypothetical protein
MFHGIFLMEFSEFRVNLDLKGVCFSLNFGKCEFASLLNISSETIDNRFDLLISTSSIAKAKGLGYSLSTQVASRLCYWWSAGAKWAKWEGENVENDGKIVEKVDEQYEKL